MRRCRGSAADLWGRAFTAPFSDFAGGLMIQDGLLWIGEQSSDAEGRIFGVDPASGVLTNFLSFPLGGSAPYAVRSLDSDGADTWLGLQGFADNQIRKVDSDGNVLAAFTSPYGSCQQGLAFDGQDLWVTGSCGEQAMTISKLDAATGDVLLSFSPSWSANAVPPPVPEPASLVLLATGLAGAGLRYMKKRRTPSKPSTADRVCV